MFKINNEGTIERRRSGELIINFEHIPQLLLLFLLLTFSK